MGMHELSLGVDDVCEVAYRELHNSRQSDNIKGKKAVNTFHESRKCRAYYLINECCDAQSWKRHCRRLHRGAAVTRAMSGTSYESLRLGSLLAT